MEKTNVLDPTTELEQSIQCVLGAFQAYCPQLAGQEYVKKVVAAARRSEQLEKDNARLAECIKASTEHILKGNF